MKRFRVVALALVLSISALVVVGCIHKVNSSNPAVVKAVTLLDARKTINSVAHGLKAANDTIKAVSVSDGESEYYAFVHPKLVELAKLNDSADDCVSTAEAGGICDWRSSIFLIAQASGDPAVLTAFGFKNPGTQAKVQLGFAGLISAIKLAQQFGTQ